MFPMSVAPVCRISKTHSASIIVRQVRNCKGLWRTNAFWGFRNIRRGRSGRHARTRQCGSGRWRNPRGHSPLLQTTVRTPFRPRNPALGRTKRRPSALLSGRRDVASLHVLRLHVLSRDVSMRDSVLLQQLDSSALRSRDRSR